MDLLEAAKPERSYYTYGDIKDLPREEKLELVDGISHL
jgi:hypothetical protein